MLVFILACGNKNTEPAPPPVGWYQEEGWTHNCYHPPNYDSLLEGDRALARVPQTLLSYHIGPLLQTAPRKEPRRNINICKLSSFSDFKPKLIRS